MNTRSTFSRRCVVGLSGLVAVSAGFTLASVPPAFADSFTEGGSTPTVMMTYGPDPTMTPTAQGTSYQMATVRATDAEGSDDIRTVTACFVSDASGVSDCTNPDPRNAILMSWSKITGSFSIQGAGSTGGIKPAGSYGPDNSSVDQQGSTTINVTFRFSASEVARAGGWHFASATATDAESNTGYADASSLGMFNTTMNGYQAISVRPDVDFGAIGTGNNSGTRGYQKAVGTIISNEQVDVSMQTGGPFTDGGPDSLYNMAGTPSGTDLSSVPSPGQYAYDCAPGNSYSITAQGAVRISDNTPQPINQDVTPSGTTEAGDNTVMVSCVLRNGGTQTALGTQFTNQITTTVSAG